MSEIEEIKRLAKETLEKKWYPINAGKDICFTSECSFCHDKEERDRSEPDIEIYTAFCTGCLIQKYNNKICDIIKLKMNTKDIAYIITQLEQLAEKGVLE